MGSQVPVNDNDGTDSPNKLPESSAVNAGRGSDMGAVVNFSRQLEPHSGAGAY